MNTTNEHSTSVQILNTEYLRLLIQQDSKYRDRMWCIQLEEHLTNMEDHQGSWRLGVERKLLNEVYENLQTKHN